MKAKLTVGLRLGLTLLACAILASACSKKRDGATATPTPQGPATATTLPATATPRPVPGTATATAPAGTPSATPAVATATPRPLPGTPPPTSSGGGYIYSVKYVCGMVQGGAAGPVQSLQNFAPVVGAIYRTAINVHNYMDVTVTITKKAVIALPEDEARGAISKRVQDVLKDDEALEVDCQDVLKLLANVGTSVNPNGFVTGFVEIQSPVEIQVTAVYTTELGTNGVKVDVEQIAAHLTK